MTETTAAPTTSPLSAPTPAAPAAAAPAAPSANPSVNLYPEGGGDTPPVEKVAEPAPVEEPKSEDPPVEEPKAEDKKDEKAPAFELKLPEGAEATEALGTFTTFATEAGLDQTNAQKLLDMHFAEMKKVTDAGAQAFNTQLTEWAKQIETDAELGGDKAPVVATTIGKALDEYGSAEARAAFDTTGAGWNPAIVRFVYKMASALSEGKPITGSPPSTRRASTPSERLYGAQQT